MSSAGGPIARVGWQSFRVPFAAAAATSRGTLGVREGFIISVETADGRTGVGEASPLSDFEGGNLDGVHAAIERFAQAIAGLTADEAWSRQLLAAGVSGPSQRVARTGIETALADLLSQDAGEPMWKWLGSRGAMSCDEPPEIPANGLVDAPTPGGVVIAVTRLVSAGYSTIKLKVGADTTTDLARIAAARGASANVELRVDANGALDGESALHFLRACEPFGVSLCEQPLDPRRPDVLEATAALRRTVSVPIALDESCRAPDTVRRAVAAGAAAAIVVKPMFTGVKAAIEMLGIARGANLPCIVTTTFDTGIGTAVATHVAALLPAPRPACGLATLSRLEHAFIDDGEFCDAPLRRPPGGGGLGVRLDEDALERYAGDLHGSVTA